MPVLPSRQSEKWTFFIIYYVRTLKKFRSNSNQQIPEIPSTRVDPSVVCPVLLHYYKERGWDDLEAHSMSGSVYLMRRDSFDVVAQVRLSAIPGGSQPREISLM